VLTCSRPNVPRSILWFFRAAALIGLAMMWLGPRAWRPFAASALLASMGAGALMTMGTVRQSAEPGGGRMEIRLGKLLLAVVGVGLLGAAGVVAVADCERR
jgi:hypothetical protein